MWACCASQLINDANAIIDFFEGILCLCVCLCVHCIIVNANLQDLSFFYQVIGLRYWTLTADLCHTFMHTFTCSQPHNGSLMIKAAPGVGPMPGPISKILQLSRRFQTKRVGVGFERWENWFIFCFFLYLPEFLYWSACTNQHVAIS